MKKLSLILLLLLVSVWQSARADEPLRVQNFEGEARVGVATGLGWTHHARIEPGLALGLELRQNIKNTPWDVGIMFDLTQSEYSFPYRDRDDRYSVGNRVLAVSVVGDYNLRQGRKINPFAGLGIGFAGYSQVDGTDISGNNVVFTPRIGVEFLHHIRLTGSFHVIRKGFNAFDISIGFVIGGRPKKQ